MPAISIAVYLIRRSALPEYFTYLASLGAGHALIGMQGRFYALPGDERVPEWAVKLSGVIVPAGALTDLCSQNPSALMNVRVRRRVMCICFGHAWMKLKDEWLVNNFGRHVVLNSISELDLRQIGTEQVLGKRHRSSERAPKNSTLHSFSYESDRDLVFSVQGYCAKGPFTGHISGGTGVRVETETSKLWKTLRTICRRTGLGYRIKFPEIDNLTQVRVDSDILALDQLLDQEIRKGSAASITMAPPAHLEQFKEDIYFVLGRWKKNHSKSWFLSYLEWIAAVGGGNVTLSAAESYRIHVVDAKTGNKISDFPARSAFAYDLTRSDGHYVTFSGLWYKASPHLEAKINGFLARLATTQFPPLAWNQKDDEATYNKGVCSSNPSLLLMDARNINYGGGQSKFEFCDFVDPSNKVLYFVKNGRSSAGMSHLYEQARRTTELFFGNNVKYLTALRQVLAKYHAASKLAWIQVSPRASDWEVCLVSMGSEADRLPMFAKCGLMRVHRDLELRNIGRVTFCAV